MCYNNILVIDEGLSIRIYGGKNCIFLLILPKIAIDKFIHLSNFFSSESISMFVHLYFCALYLHPHSLPLSLLLFLARSLNLAHFFFTHTPHSFFHRSRDSLEQSFVFIFIFWLKCGLLWQLSPMEYIECNSKHTHTRGIHEKRINENYCALKLVRSNQSNPLPPSPPPLFL